MQGISWLKTKKFEFCMSPMGVLMPVVVVDQIDFHIKLSDRNSLRLRTTAIVHFYFQKYTSLPVYLMCIWYTHW